jgi:ABC-2 type transport system ATP-binding protein
MINIQNVDYFWKKAPLFNDLCLQLKPGSIYGLLGKNGAGKSTLLKLIAGLLFPKKGSITAMGVSPSEKKLQFLQQTYFLPELFFLPKITAKQYLCCYASFYPHFDKQKFHQFLEEFQINTSKSLSNLSHGDQKKFLISFGMATQTKYLLLDEPSNGLDIPSKKQLRKVLAGNINEERIIIISTHQVKDIEYLIDPIIILDEGKVVFNQDIQSIQEAFLFSLTLNPPEDENHLHTESNGGRHTTIQDNINKDDSPIDLEALFNMVVTNPKKITELLQTKSQ